MRALPARRIALGALCAALLTTITGPTASAADSLPGRDRAASLVARLPQTDTAPTDLTPVTDLVRAVLAAPGGQLPAAEARRLAAAAREAIDRAANDDPSSTSSTSSTTVTVVSGSSTPVTPALPGTAAPATGVLLPTTEEDGTPAVDLGALREAMENLLNVLLPKADQAAADSGTTTPNETSSTSETSVNGTAESTEGTETADGTAATETATTALPSTGELLARVRELLDALTGTAPQTATTLPAPAGPAAPATTPGVVPALTSLLLPNS
ncbi:hypothetical protein ACPCK2_10225 [Streptomyces pseudogriseolus]|uniref:hypothetical protein n=1 Tax=Streptomyces pseudogriseolus TaxID=36817 RepID=UPI003FA30F67